MKPALIAVLLLTIGGGATATPRHTAAPEEEYLCVGTEPTFLIDRPVDAVGVCLPFPGYGTAPSPWTLAPRSAAAW